MGCWMMYSFEMFDIDDIFVRVMHRLGNLLLPRRHFVLSRK
jgi:hypothetical protein